MNFYKIFFVNIIVVLFFLNSLGSTIKNKIIVKVGSEIVTLLELENKVNTSLILSKQNITQNNINNIKNLILKTLIDHKIKKNELKKYNIEINQLAIDNHIRKISNNLDIDVKELRNFFNSNRISYDLYLDEIKTEFLWQRLILQIYSNKINIDESEIEKELKNKILNNKKTYEYNLAEIEIFIQDGNQKQVVDKIKNSINEIGFEETAKKYSISDTALNGGLMGWVNADAINNNLRNKIEKLQIGSISGEIINANSLIFLKMVNKREISMNENIDLEKMKVDLINRKKSDVLGLYSSSHLSKIRNNTLIELK